jgi:hypothetical protein
LALDANFRLKLKDRGIEDPEVDPGWAYFVEHGHYIGHISQTINDKEVGRFSKYLCYTFDNSTSKRSLGVALHSTPSTKRTTGQKDMLLPELLPVYVHVIPWSRKTALETCNEANGALLPPFCNLAINQRLYSSATLVESAAPFS